MADERRAWLGRAAIPLLAALAFAGSACADDGAGGVVPLVLRQEDSSCRMAPYLEWIEDPSATLEIDDVTAPDMAARFKPVGSHNLNLGMTTSAVWLRFSITTPEASPADHDWILDMGWVALGSVRLFVPDAANGSWKVSETGSLYAPKPRNDPLNMFCALRLPVPPALGTWTCYVRVKADASMLLPITLRTQEAHSRYSDALILGYGVFYGLITAMVFTNLSAYRWLKDTSLLWFSLMLLFVLLYFLEFNMIRGRFFPIQNTAVPEKLSHLYMACALISMVPFYRSCLQVDRPSRWINAMSTAYMVIAIPGVIITFLPFASLQFAKAYDTFVGCGVLIIIAASTAASWRSRYRPGRLLPVAWAIFGVFTFRHILTLWGYLPVTQWSYHTLQIGVAGLCVVFSYAVWYRLKVIRNDDERAVRRSEVRYRLLAENITDVIWTLDTELRFTYVSPSIKQVQGYSVEEAMRTRIEDHMPPDSVELARRTIGAALAEKPSRPRGRETPIVFELEQYGKDGGLMWTEIRASVLRDDQGRALGVLGVTQDITERKRAEAQRRELEEQLAQAQKMESVGRLAGGVAHDFNNLLMAILGYTEIMLGDPHELTHGLREGLEEIKRAGERARDLTRQLLAFGRKQTLEIRTLDLNEVVVGFGKMLRRLIGEDIQVRTLLNPRIAAVKADPAQIEQVLLNLAVNARDAMPKGGILTIKTGNVTVDQAPVPAHPHVDPGSYVTLAVTDTGCGMSSETQKAAFEPFFTTKGPGEGTGLGLATVYGIVKQHGGHISVDSKVGEGTTFTVYLPCAQEIDGLDDAAEEQLPLIRGTETVLVVEDDAAVRLLAHRLLTRLGYSVIEADGGPTALKLAAEHQEIDLLLTDVIMPEMSGKNVYEQVAALHPGIRVIYMSGYTADIIAHRGVLDDGVHLLQKPFTLQSLAQKINEVLER